MLSEWVGSEPELWTALTNQLWPSVFNSPIKQTTVKRKERRFIHPEAKERGPASP